MPSSSTSANSSLRRSNGSISLPKDRTDQSPLLNLPKHPSISHIKQAHALAIAVGAAVAVAGRLLAAVSLSTSPPPHYSRALFNRIKHPDVFARNNIIRCYAKGDAPGESLALYAAMCRRFERPNNYTFPFLLQACSKISWLGGGTQVHAHVVKLGFQEDVFIRNALIHFYGVNHELGDCRRVFEESPQRCDVVTWNAVLAGYARDGQMDVVRTMFEKMPQRDVISWSTVLVGHVQGGELEVGLVLFDRMREEGVVPNEAVWVTVLSAIAQLGLLERGRSVHSAIKELSVSQSLGVGTALVDMYAKCGCIELSEKVFNEMPKKDVFAWNAMIFGLAIHGFGVKAMDLFQKFVAVGLTPVNITFVGVLTACSRIGFVDEGRTYFKLMTEKYGIEPEMEHYGCMVDLLGRAGFVEEAIDLIENMTLQPDPVLWGILLGACKTHGLLDLGENIGQKLLQLDPGHDGHYVLLGSIYAKKNKWEEVTKIRRLMITQGANKLAGWSLIEAQGGLHRFLAGDKSHMRSKEIYEMLEEMGKRLEKAGYSPDVSSVLHDIGKEEKEQIVKEHSERLAIAFGLMVTVEEAVIRIVKNLRVCGDCHEATKKISEVYGREIVVRDGSRFHHFREGKCSCLDFW